MYGQGGSSGSRCKVKVRDQGGCNSCAAQSTVTALEFCLCLAGERDLQPRSVQQVSECTNGEIKSDFNHVKLTYEIN